MTAVDVLSTQQRPENIAQRPQGVPGEPHLPVGKPLRSAQPLPLPLISQPEGPKPVHDEQALRLRTAQARAEFTGTGVIVDTIV